MPLTLSAFLSLSKEMQSSFLSEYMVSEWILEHDEGSPWATHSPDMRRQKMSEYTHLMRIEKTDAVQKLVFVVRPGDIDGNAVMGLKITYSVILKNGSDKVDFEAKTAEEAAKYIFDEGTFANYEKPVTSSAAVFDGEWTIDVYNP